MLFRSQAKVIHIDIDPAEIDKNVQTHAKIIGDAKEVLLALTDKINISRHKDWSDSFNTHEETEYDKVIKKELFPENGPIKMGEAIRKISEATSNNAVLVTDVGQNQIMAARYFKYSQTRSVITSGGLGTMGFGIPAAIGAKIGAPERTVCMFAGDGGFQMTIQELGTIMQDNIGVKMIILNNKYLGMVRQWQTLFYGQRYSNTILEDKGTTL